MGDFWDTPIPTLGEIGTSLKDKFGRMTNGLAGQAQAFTLAQKFGQGGFDAAPDDDPSKSAVAPQAPRAVAEIAGPAPPSGDQPGRDIGREATLRDEMARRGMASGAYQNQTGYGEFGTSNPRSLAAMLQDREAAAQLDASYGARERANQAFAPDYQGDALKARLRDAEYEANSEAPRPLYSGFDKDGNVTTLGSFYKGSNGSFSNTPAGPTLKQQFQIQQDRLKNGDKILDLGRGELAGQVQTLRAKLDAYVQHRIPWNGKILSQADADAIYAKAVKDANDPVSILKPGFPPVDPNAIPGGPVPQQR